MSLELRNTMAQYDLQIVAKVGPLLGGIGFVQFTMLNKTRFYRSIQIENSDLCQIIYYALTNTDLEGRNDPRIQTVEWVKAGCNRKHQKSIKTILCSNGSLALSFKHTKTSTHGDLSLTASTGEIIASPITIPMGEFMRIAQRFLSQKYNHGDPREHLVGRINIMLIGPSPNKGKMRFVETAHTAH